MLHRAHLRRKAALRQLLRVGFRAVQLVVMGFLFWRFFSEFFALDLVKVDRALAVRGVVTKCDVNRQHFNWYLNHDEDARYDFWSFEPANAATKRLITADSLDFIVTTGDSSGYTYYNTLGYYLRTGARLHKSANSPYIHVVQNHQRTRWQYRP